MAKLIQREQDLGEIKEVRLNVFRKEYRFIFKDGDPLVLKQELFEQFFKYDGELPGQEIASSPVEQKAPHDKKTDNKRVDLKGD